jgi:capsular exopolysaccharide synthesis family protein
MDLNELLQVLWRRKLVFLATFATVIAVAVVALQVVTPQYESTSTIVLEPTGERDDLSFFLSLGAVVPVYANAASSRTTRIVASQRLGREVGEVTVDSDPDVPILKIRVRDEDPEQAQKAAQAVTDVLIDRVEDGGLGLEQVEVNQVEEPAVAEEPVFPQEALTLAVAVVLGLGFGVGMALLRETLTSQVETAEELAAIAGVPVYGEIPLERKLPTLSSPDELSANTEFRIIAESMRDLRTNLQFSENGFRSVVVTSPEGRHGKTTVSFGLATTLARAGTRTLLVDGDLRRGRIAELLELPRSPGLWDVLNGLDVAKAAHKTSLATLHVLTAGEPADNPGEVLSTRFPETLDKLKADYDVVVLDSTPLVPVNDARIMASAVETTLIVASAGSTKRRQVREALERLSRVAVKPTAVVLNRSRVPRGDYYYGSE